MSDAPSITEQASTSPSTDPTLPMVLAASRTLVATFGGFAIARGWIGADQASQMGGAVVVLVAGAFGIYSQYRNKQHLAHAMGAAAPVAPVAATTTVTGGAQ